MSVTEQRHPPVTPPPGAERFATVRGRLQRLSTDRELRRQMVSFGVIGVGCTIAFALLYSLLRHEGASALAANGLALLATMGVNFALNRAYTFPGHHGTFAAQLGGYVVAYLLGLGASSLALLVLLDALGHPKGLVDTLCALFSGLLATAVRFVLMRMWVFRPLQA